MEQPVRAQNAGQRPLVENSDDSIRSSVFSFVTVRSPQPVSSIAQTGFFRPDAQRLNSSFLTQLTNIAANPSGPSAERNDALRAVARETTGTSAFAERRTRALVDVSSLVTLGHWLQSNQEVLTPALLNERPSATAASVDIERVLWEAFVGAGVLNEPTRDYADVQAALRAQYFLQHVSTTDLNDPYQLRRLVAPELVLPGNVLPQQPVVAPTPPPSSAEQAAERQRLAAQWDKFNTYSQAAAELRKVAAVRFEEARVIPPPPLFQDSEVVSELNGSSGTAARAADDSVAAWLDKQVRAETLADSADLTPAARQAVDEVSSNPESLRLPFLIQQLEQQAAQAASALAQATQTSRTVFVAGGAVWSNDPSGPAIGEQNREDAARGSGTNVNMYEGFYDNEDVSRIKPLGIADLNRVEQKLCCYKPGDVAHIENVMQGEYKERTTRRLRRSEETFTLSTEREETQEKDTITTDRHELEKASSQVLSQDTSFGIGVTATASYGPVNVAASSNFSTSSSLQQTDQQAQAFAKNVTDRSLQRIVERVREERVTKLIDEYEETNQHGLDNSRGDKHVVGLYRWVDKLYQAQIVNYGKRLMFEFMVPEPGNFHLWAMSRPAASSTSVLQEPIDPRQEGLLVPGTDPADNIRFPKLTSHTVLAGTNQESYAAWAAAYGAEVSPPPPGYVYVGLGLTGSGSNSTASGLSKELVVPEGYEADLVKVQGNTRWSDTGDPSVTVFVGDQGFWFHTRGSGGIGRGGLGSATIQPISGSVPISYLGTDTDIVSINVTVRCKLKPETLEEWRIATFNAIMKAYQTKKDAYDSELANLRSQQQGLIGIQGTNPALNRTIEQTELKKGCIHWLFNGRDYSTWGVWRYGDTVNPPHVNTDAATLAGGERAKFIEQCFEWPLMTYTLYPYFWAGRSEWRRLYTLNDADPLFLNFLQSGMARVHVPIRPRYEKAAMHLLKTGEVWNGDGPPPIDSPIYVSIVDELRQPVGTRVGQPWEVRVPTTLTVLQAKSGAIDGEGLPCDCEPAKAIGAGESGKLTGQL
jgi:hypothetical protein